MRAVQKQPLNSATEYKNLRAKVDKLMETINRKKFSIRNRVEILHCINPK